MADSAPEPTTAPLEWISHQTWPDVKYLLERYRDSSYLHPYGFVVVRTSVPYFPGWHIRAHFWRSDNASAADGFAVHSHGWDILSKVVLGELVERSFVAEPDPDGAHQIFQVQSSFSVGSSRLKAIKRSVSLKMTNSEIRTRHSPPMVLHQDVFHSTSGVGKYLSVSIAATSAANGKSSYVIGPQGRDEETFIRSEPDTIDSLISEASDLYRIEASGEDDWAAFTFVYDRNNRVAMSRTFRSPEYWAPVGGRRKRGDASPIDTAIREIREETSVLARPNELTFLGTECRDIGEGVTHFWALELADPAIVHPDMAEFVEFQWKALTELQKLKLYKGTENILGKLGSKLHQKLN